MRTIFVSIVMIGINIGERSELINSSDLLIPLIFFAIGMILSIIKDLKEIFMD